MCRTSSFKSCRRGAGAHANMHERKHKEVINRTGTRGGYLRPVQKDITELSRIRGCTYKCATASGRVVPRRISRGDIPCSFVSGWRDKLILINDDDHASRTNKILIIQQWIKVNKKIYMYTMRKNILKQKKKLFT